MHAGLDLPPPRPIAYSKDVPIRRATRADAALVGQLICELARYEHLEDEIAWDELDLEEALFGHEAVPSVLLSQTAKGEAAGFALYFPTFSTLLGRPGIWLEDLFIRPEHRGRGLGRELLEALRSLTSGRVEWNVLAWNGEAIRFYDRIGAVPVEGWVTYRWLPGTRPLDDE